MPEANMANDFTNRRACLGANAQSHRESDDSYRGVLHIAGRWRIAICRDAVQFLVQRQRPGKSGVGGPWDSQRYCVTRAALIRDWHALAGNPSALPLDLLPARASMLASQLPCLPDRRSLSAGRI